MNEPESNHTSKTLVYSTPEVIKAALGASTDADDTVRILKALAESDERRIRALSDHAPAEIPATTLWDTLRSLIWAAAMVVIMWLLWGPKA